MLPFGVKNKRTCFLYSPFALSLPERMTVSYESLCFSARCLQRCCRYSYGVRGDLRTDCLSGRQASVLAYGGAGDAQRAGRFAPALP